MKRRFVILLHTGYGPDHYDLMIEDGASLATWQLDCDPRDLEFGQSLPVRRLPDHRAAYLDYEGPVSANRGSVGAMIRGTIELIESSENIWRFEWDVCGSVIRGELSRQGGDVWRFSVTD